MMIWFYGHNSASPLIMHFKLYEGKKLSGASSIKTALKHLAHIVPHHNHRHHHSFMNCDLPFFPWHKGDISCVKREFMWSQPKNPSSSFFASSCRVYFHLYPHHSLCFLLLHVGEGVSEAEKTLKNSTYTSRHSW